MGTGTGWNGTGWRAQPLKRRDIGGKTGTTNDSKMLGTAVTAWHGFTVVWVSLIT
ncbi:hypothetical protein O9993_20335 [Vibrio lentus]|nr:hypothetical protein [Vibrio lentus]